MEDIKQSILMLQVHLQDITTAKTEAEKAEAKEAFNNLCKWVAKEVNNM